MKSILINTPRVRSTKHVTFYMNKFMTFGRAPRENLESEIISGSLTSRWEKYLHSKFTVKSKLRSSHIDDSRPTQITKPIEKPGFYCIFAGKINSIYEVEKLIDW